MNNALVSAKKYIDYLKEKGIIVSSAYLFGSYAKGNAKEWSDIDVCVVSPDFGKDYFDEMLYLQKFTSSIDDRIEPHPRTQEDLNDPYDIFANEIKKYGIKIDVA